jgi:DNA-binding transcriptional MerR regulator
MGLASPAPDRRWKIGELAAATGLTIRTLHHYDEIGLLAAGERSEGGHRLYGPRDVERLYRILALRELGLSLADIAAAIDGDGGDLRGALRGHLDRVEDRIRLQFELRGRLAWILRVLERTGEPAVQKVIEVMEFMAMHDRYYTPEQQAALQQRAEAMGGDALRRSEQEWADLIAEVRTEHERGTDPASPRMRELATRWRALVEQFTGGDPGIRRSLATMYRQEDPLVVSHGALDRELMAYAMRAVQALDG